MLEIYDQSEKENVGLFSRHLLVLRGLVNVWNKGPIHLFNSYRTFFVRNLAPYWENENQF